MAGLPTPHIRNISILRTQLGFAVHHLACTAQPKGQTGMGQVIAFARVGWWNIVQVVMLHWVVEQ